MHWVWPVQVLLLAGVLGPVLGLLAWHAARRRRQALAAWAGGGGEAWPAGVSPRWVALRAAALAGALVLILTALARPQYGMTEAESEIRGPVVVVVDGSASMRARDVSPSRLELARQWVHDLAAQLPGCRLGLIAFAGEAQVLCPPTEDQAVFGDLLTEIPGGLAGENGTELGPALDLGRRALTRAGGGVLVLVTDGEYHDRDPGTALRGRSGDVLGLVTVTVGRSVPVPVPGSAAGTVVSDPRTGRTALTAARPAALRELARSADGLAIEATSSGAATAAAVRFIQERLAPRAGAAVGPCRTERFQWPVGLALVLLVLRLATPTGLRARPRAAAWRLGGSLAAAFCLVATVRGAGVPGAAAAIAELRAASLRAPGHDRPRCLYNLALALHESGQRAEARAAYLEALALRGGTAEVRARCLNNLGALDMQDVQERAAEDAGAALAALARGEAAWREALRLDPRLEVARCNLQGVGALADLLRARAAVVATESAARSSTPVPAPPESDRDEPVAVRPQATLPVAATQAGLVGAVPAGQPARDADALERLCREAGSARDYLQIVSSRTRPAQGRPALLPW
jgi:Ca-activated chloride channel homolog